MAQTNLRDYLKRIDELVDREKYDEGIAHAAHVLRVFPKNIQALRDLGRALFGLSRLAEAEDVFRRVLSANPLDVTSHNYLSLIYERGKQMSLAIWHAERAFDQQPGNKSIVQRLRELHSAQRGEAVDKLPLTAGALANYALNQDPAQALEVLEKALEREPDRLDLRLQMARALWTADRPIDAAEVAMSILEDLPYVMQANRIMTELWLAQGRPSDAARHLSRLEEVDPYLALRLASGETPDPDAILLEELDYNAHANRQLANSVPDWLAALDDDMSEEDLFSALEESAAPEPPGSSKPRTGALPPQAQVSAASGALGGAENEGFPRGLETSQQASRTPSGLTGLLEDSLGDDDSWLNDISDSEAPPSSSPSRAPTGLTGLLGQTTSDDDDSWLRALERDDPFSRDDAPAANTPRASTGLTGFFDDVPASSLRTPTGLTGNFFDDTDDAPLPRSQEVELPEWLRDDQEASAPAQRQKSADEEFIAASDDLDPLAWLQEAGAELDEDAPNARRLRLVEDDGPTTIRSTPADPMAWLSNAGGDFFDDSGSIPSAPRFLDDDSSSEDNPLAWLQDDSLLVTDELEQSQTPSAASDSAYLDQPWLTDEAALQEALDFETLVSSGDSAPQGQDAMDSNPLFPDDDSWLSDDDKSQQPEETSDWLSEFDDDLSVEVEADADPMAWMQSYDLEASADNTSSTLAAQATDWLNDSLTEEAPESPSELDWMADFGARPEAEPVAEDQPEWMTDFGALPEAEPVAEDQPEWMTDFGAAVDEAATEDQPEWMADFGAAVDEAATEDQPEWMTDFGALPEAEPVAEDQPEWMTDFGAAVDEAATEDQPEWMTDFGALPEAEPVAEDQPEWMADFGAAVDEAATEDQPEWMINFSGVGQQVGAQIEDDLTNASSESFDQEAWDRQSEADLYQIDWLSDVAGVQDDVELQAEGTLSFDPADNAPDWLNAMVPGLDMDFTAEEDATVDVGFTNASSHRQRELSVDDFVAVNRDGIQWLHDLIEEEQRAAATLPPPPLPLPLPPVPLLTSLPPAPEVVQGPLSSAPATRSRFAFSKPPIWMSALATKPSASTPTQARTEQDDDLEDFDLADFDDLDFDEFDELDNKRKK
ncbi:MAG: tetratricopeptide repeat protein [Anaerolineae bacterium]|nr:tetratricopeptide repeat protein [Anaerolineae bacterium]MDW8172743.1 tetratricopeptide repeat protein [Anaerolineae bacterium]